MARQVKDSVLQFPFKGINVVAPRTAQPEGTCVDAKNVRVFDSLEGRVRGGMRPGLTKYCSNAVVANTRIQDINHVTVITNSSPSTGSLGIRSVVPVAVSNGAVYTLNTTAATAAGATGDASLSNTAPFIFSAELFGRLYYCDGINYKIFVGANSMAINWVPSDGSLPGTPGTRVPRLIEMWRSRLVLAGLASDPHNWFMTKLGDPLDFDYAPATTTEIQAVTGGTGVVGKVGDVINAIIPYSDDVLLFGCDHSIWQMTGDPAGGGRLDCVSDTVGIAFGRAWCKDDKGAVYFFSTRGAVYQYRPDRGLVDLTEGTISPEIIDTDLNSTLIRMVYDDAQGGVHLFMTPIA